jgi:hypothetical protein
VVRVSKSSAKRRKHEKVNKMANENDESSGWLKTSIGKIIAMIGLALASVGQTLPMISFEDVPIQAE